MGDKQPECAGCGHEFHKSGYCNVPLCECDAEFEKAIAWSEPRHIKPPPSAKHLRIEPEDPSGAAPQPPDANRKFDECFAALKISKEQVQRAASGTGVEIGWRLEL